MTPTSRNSTISGTTVPHSPSETQMLRLLNSAAQKREVKATQNLSIIVAFFMICWIPLYTINCINAFCKECFINEAVIYFGIILSHLNSAINPLLYGELFYAFESFTLISFHSLSSQRFPRRFVSTVHVQRRRTSQQLLSSLARQSAADASHITTEPATLVPTASLHRLASLEATAANATDGTHL